MLLLIITVTFTVLSGAIALYSTPRMDTSDRWMGVCIVSYTLAVASVPFVLIAVTKLMDDPRPLWLGIAIGLALLVSLQMARVNNRQQEEDWEAEE